MTAPRFRILASPSLLVTTARPPRRDSTSFPWTRASLTVDLINQTVESDHFRIQFDLTRPDMIVTLVYKDK